MEYDYGYFFFFFNDTATTEIYTLSLHDALPIFGSDHMTLPEWAVVTPERGAHIERVAALLSTWATALRVPAAERARWLRAAWLHDALRDAPAADELQHGPMAAERAARGGERDPGVLDAVRYHSLEIGRASCRERV